MNGSPTPIAAPDTYMAKAIAELIEPVIRHSFNVNASNAIEIYGTQEKHLKEKQIADDNLIDAIGNLQVAMANILYLLFKPEKHREILVGHINEITRLVKAMRENEQHTSH